MIITLEKSTLTFFQNCNCHMSILVTAILARFLRHTARHGKQRALKIPVSVLSRESCETEEMPDSSLRWPDRALRAQILVLSPEYPV